MTAKSKKWLTAGVRWGIAIAGIAYVLWQIRFHDRIRLLSSDLQIEEVAVWNDAKDTDGTFATDGRGEVPLSDLWTLPDRKVVQVADPKAEGGKKKFTLLAVHPSPVESRKPDKLLVEDAATEQRSLIEPSAVLDRDPPTVSYPLVERGVVRMAREADRIFLLAAVLVLPVIYLLTSYRWHVLLEAQEIHIGMARTFVINMVGAFYNSFMPGSTGGDLVKAYQASKHTDHRTRAVLSVLVDRIIGLLALLVLGGFMAALQFDVPECRRVALGAGAIILATAIGLLVFYHPGLRRATGLDWFLKRLPMQKQVHHAVIAMEIYGRRPGLMFWAFLCSFPVHVVTILSATLAGQAFHLPLSLAYYWVLVPVIALVGAIPISPQGAGVMEVFAVQLTIHRGVTVGQAFALVMSIRLVQIFWNLVAGLFVLRGGYHAPTAAEQHELEEEEEREEALELQQANGHPAPAATSGHPQGVALPPDPLPATPRSA